MIQLLQANEHDPREQRYVAFQFRYLRGAAVPKELIKLNETVDGRIRAAASLAITGLSRG